MFPSYVSVFRGLFLFYSCPLKCVVEWIIAWSHHLILNIKPAAVVSRDISGHIKYDYRLQRWVSKTWLFVLVVSFSFSHKHIQINIFCAQERLSSPAEKTDPWPPRPFPNRSQSGGDGLCLRLWGNVDPHADRLNSGRWESCGQRMIKWAGWLRCQVTVAH